MNFLSTFFDTQQFAPHGQCLLWQSDLLILYTVSDTAIALAYFAYFGLVGDRPLPGVNQELADLHHDAIQAFGGVVDLLQTGSSVAVPPWNAALDATIRWLGMAEQGREP